MSVKHSPGPWTHAPKEVLGNSVLAGNLLICLLCGSGEESDANGRLIAAAPELLDDAKSTDQGYDWFRDELLSFRNYFGAQTVKQTEAFIDSLIAHLDSRQIGTRAAIAKAEGGQS